MSIDKSLVSKSKLVRQRNVLTRPERIKHLTDEGLWDEKKSVYGLPKVKILKIKKKVKVKKAAEVATDEAAGDKEKAS
ncbi:MAG: small basic protein [Candidatus Scalindua sp.]